MAQVISTLADAISYLNTLYEVDSTSPSSGDEDYTVWTALFNIGIDLWENEEGVLWKELFVKLSAAADGDKTTDGTTSYSVPTDFRHEASSYVWIGTGTTKTSYRVIPIEKVQLYENDKGNWCYFTTSTLEFNPNLTLDTGSTINYNYYKQASKLTTSTDTFDMSDPMFCVFYALSELKKEEGDPTASAIATQKLEAMKTKNISPTWFMDDTLDDPTQEGFGV